MADAPAMKSVNLDEKSSETTVEDRKKRRGT